MSCKLQKKYDKILKEHILSVKSESIDLPQVKADFPPKKDMIVSDLCENYTILDIQQYFNKFFKDDLYGRFRDDDNIILSSGSLYPDEFPLPPSLRYTIDFALEKNWYGYSDSRGRISARRAAADFLNARAAREDFCTVDQISMICGVTNGIATLLEVFRDMWGDNFNIVTHLPNYSPFLTLCQEKAEVKVAPIDVVSPSADIFFNVINERTKFILITGDINPCGVMLPIAELNKLIEFCEGKGIYILFDEAGAKFPSYDLHELVSSSNLIIMNSDSKSLGIPGMKTGYIMAASEIIDRFYSYASASYGSPASFFYLLQEFYFRFEQFIASGIFRLSNQELTLFEDTYELNLPFLQLLYEDYKITIEHYYTKLVSKRNRVVNALRNLEPAYISKVIMPQTGVNIFVKIKNWDNSYRFFLKLLEEEQTAVFPGLCSGANNGCWIRITYSLEDEVLEEGLQRLVAFLQKERAYDVIQKNDFYYKLLVEKGKYNSYERLNFYQHLEEVLCLMKAIYKQMQIGDAEHNLELSEKVALCHDAGKVISVQLACVHRILNLQQAHAPSWDQFKDFELLGLKAELIKRQRFTQEELMSHLTGLEKYTGLIDFEKTYSPCDALITEQLLCESSNDKEEYSHIAALLAEKPKKINDDSSPESIMRAVLDIADKCSDYMCGYECKMERIIEALEHKKQYVSQRYSGGQVDEIAREFEIAAYNAAFIFHQ